MNDMAEQFEFIDGPCDIPEYREPLPEAEHMILKKIEETMLAQSRQTTALLEKTDRLEKDNITLAVQLERLLERSEMLEQRHNCGTAGRAKIGEIEVLEENCAKKPVPASGARLFIAKKVLAIRSGLATCRDHISVLVNRCWPIFGQRADNTAA